LTGADELLQAYLHGLLSDSATTALSSQFILATFYAEMSETTLIRSVDGLSGRLSGLGEAASAIPIAAGQSEFLRDTQGMTPDMLGGSGPSSSFFGFMIGSPWCGRQI
jgi:hypothetical protein